MNVSCNIMLYTVLRIANSSELWTLQMLKLILLLALVPRLPLIVQLHLLLTQMTSLPLHSLLQSPKFWMNLQLMMFNSMRLSTPKYTCLLSIIDAKTRQLWNFPTASKRPPLSILSYFLALLQKEGITTITI